MPVLPLKRRQITFLQRTCMHGCIQRFYCTCHRCLQLHLFSHWSIAYNHVDNFSILFYCQHLFTEYYVAKARCVIYSYMVLIMFSSSSFARVWKETTHHAFFFFKLWVWKEMTRQELATIPKTQEPHTVKNPCLHPNQSISTLKGHPASERPTANRSIAWSWAPYRLGARTL